MDTGPTSPIITFQKSISSSKVLSYTHLFDILFSLKFNVTVVRPREEGRLKF